MSKDIIQEITKADYKEGFVTDVEQEFLPDLLQGTRFYDPGDNPRERETRKFLAERWKEKYGY